MFLHDLVRRSNIYFKYTNTANSNTDFLTDAAWVQEAKKRGLKISPLAGLQMAPVFFAMFSTFALTFWFGVKLYSEHRISSVSTVVM